MRRWRRSTVCIGSSDIAKRNSQSSEALRASAAKMAFVTVLPSAQTYMSRFLALQLLFLLATATAQTPDPRPVILAFGDSITAGFGVDADHSYPAQLQKELDARGYAYRVVNQGVSGSSTIGALGRLTRALTVQPHVVILQFGGND